MPFDASPQVVGVLAFFGLLALVVAVLVVCSGRREELEAGIDGVLAQCDEEARNAREAAHFESLPDVNGGL